MQKVKSVQIGKQSFTLKELNTRAVWDLMNNEQGGNEAGAGFPERFGALLTMACPELTKEALLDLYPSEIKELWVAFEEVNADFLEVVRQFGIDLALIEAVRGVVKASIEQFACSLPTGTVQ